MTLKRCIHEISGRRIDWIINVGNDCIQLHPGGHEEDLRMAGSQPRCESSTIPCSMVSSPIWPKQCSPQG